MQRGLIVQDLQLICPGLHYSMQVFQSYVLQNNYKFL